MKITAIINGTPVALRASAETLLASLVARASVQKLMSPSTVESVEVRDASGTLLEKWRTLGELRIASGARLFLSPRVGFGG